MTKAIQPSTHGVHAIAVGATAADGHEWGVIDSTRLLSALDQPQDRACAEAISRQPLDPIEPGAPLSEAVRVMNERKVTHLVVVDGGHPAGIISALDVAGAVAWGRA